MNFFNNKQMIHIFTEIIVLLSVVYYFHNKTKSLQERIKDQDERLEKHERILGLLYNTHLQNQKKTTHVSKKQPTKPTPVSTPTPTPVETPVHIPVEITPPPSPQESIIDDIPEDQRIVEIKEPENTNEETEENLDNEIEEELKELDVSDVEGI